MDMTTGSGDAELPKSVGKLRPQGGPRDAAVRLESEANRSAVPAQAVP